MNPNDLEYQSFNKQTVDWIDSLIEYQKKYGGKTRVDGEGDWKVLGYMYKGLKVLHPEQMKQFEDSVKFYRSINKFGKGVKHEGDAMIQHRLEMPEVFFHFLKILYPFQQLDKKFVKGIEEHFPEFITHE